MAPVVRSANCHLEVYVGEHKLSFVQAREGRIDLDTDQTLTPESSLPEMRASPSFVKRKTFT